MDYIMVIIIIMLLIGLGIMIYSIFMKDSVVQSVSTVDTDKAIDEFNNLSKDIFSEFDEKYKELMFLYEMLDAKKDDSKTEVREAVKQAEKKISVMVNPKLKEIMELKNSGMTVNQIARTLNMGQGEVQLILNLGGKR